MNAQARPLSPHLQIYRWRITMWLSSMHRISGLLLTLGAFVFCGWLIALASGAESYRSAQAVYGAAWFKPLLLLWTLAFFYHLANGIRHLVWDTGHGFERGQIRTSGWTVIIVAVAAALVYAFAVIF
ncbi:MAG TPA: succinate dehydrogenase, cytochrome b556 subunit [Gammaproteobacteria bacterium]